MTTLTVGAGHRMTGLLCLISAFVLNACGGGKTTSPATGGPTNPGGGGPTEQWATVSSRSWSMPAQSEGYECHTQLVASDEYFTGFRLASPSAGQTELYLTTRTSVSTTGDFSCSFSDVTGGEAVYAADAGTTQVTFAGGKGVHVAAGQYLMLIVHVNNSSATPIVNASTVVEGRVATAAAVTTPIDMFFAGKPALAIPTSADSVDGNGSCEIGSELHVVAGITLMRSLGIHGRVTATIGALNSVLFDGSFDPSHVLYSSLSTDFDMPANSRVTVTCSFTNHTGAVVNIGESAQDELCLGGIYRYPPKPPASMSPFECLLGQTI